MEDNCFLNKWVSVDHPKTCLNPDEYFQIKYVKVEGCPMDFKISIRGEKTCWFSSKSIVDWSDEHPDVVEERFNKMFEGCSCHTK